MKSNYQRIVDRTIFFLFAICSCFSSGPHTKWRKRNQRCIDDFKMRPQNESFSIFCSFKPRISDTNNDSHHTSTECRFFLLFSPNKNVTEKAESDEQNPVALAMTTIAIYVETIKMKEKNTFDSLEIETNLADDQCDDDEKSTETETNKKFSTLLWSKRMRMRAQIQTSLSYLSFSLLFVDSRTPSMRTQTLEHTFHSSIARSGRHIFFPWIFRSKAIWTFALVSFESKLEKLTKLKNFIFLIFLRLNSLHLKEKVFIWSAKSNWYIFSEVFISSKFSWNQRKWFSISL